mmetsp:Transcript_9617/g.22303  ORF Transcript_9617/g.22303 Transcript_9617/m.22303 type:complete len:269 (-) Transcript_9617:6694-7500(-)
MTAHDAQRADADDTRRQHIFLVALHQRRAAHGTRVLHPAGQRDGQHEDDEGQCIGCMGKQAAGDAADHQCDEDGREGQHHIADTHHQGIHTSTDEAGQQAQAHAQQHGQQHRGDAHQQRYAGAVHQGGQDVSPLPIGAEQVLGLAARQPGRRLERIEQFQRREIKRVVRRDHFGEQRTGQTDQRNTCRQHRDRGASKGVPDIAVEETLQRGHRDVAHGSVGLAIDAQPRIDREIQEIDAQVDRDEDQRNQAEVGRHHRDVCELNRLDE